MIRAEALTGSEPDYQLRTKVAACTKILVANGVMTYSGHVSARVPDRTDAFFIQPIDSPRSGLHPDDLLVCDLNGAILDGRAGRKAPAEVALHCEIFRARADVNAIAHFHHDRTNSFTLVDDRPLPLVKNHAIRWRNGIPVHPDPAHVANAELGRAVARTLGSCHAMQIRAHGQVVTAESVEAVLVDSIHFVENAEAAYAAALLGVVRPLSEADIESFARYFLRGRHIDKLWRYYVETSQASGLLASDWPLL